MNLGILPYFRPRLPRPATWLTVGVLLPRAHLDLYSVYARLGKAAASLHSSLVIGAGHDGPNSSMNVLGCIRARPFSIPNVSIKLLLASPDSISRDELMTSTR
jgi:hypothetical protein